MAAVEATDASSAAASNPVATAPASESTVAAGPAVAMAQPAAQSGAAIVPAAGSTVSTGMPQPGYMGHAGGYMGQMGGYGQPAGYPGVYPQQSGYGGYPGQPGGYPGQPGGYPGQPGMPPGQELAPQLNFRTAIRCIMEVAAIVQGCALVATMGSGWAQEVGSNEEQPLRRFGMWIYKSLRGIVWTVLPFLKTRSRRISLEDAWATESLRPPTRTRWWVWIGFVYFAVVLTQEFRALRRIRVAKVVPAALADVPKSGAEGDAAGGGGVTGNRGVAGTNVVDFYMQKQRELHAQKTAQLSNPAPKAPTSFSNPVPRAPPSSGSA